MWLVPAGVCRASLANPSDPERTLLSLAPSGVRVASGEIEKASLPLAVGRENHTTGILLLLLTA